VPPLVLHETVLGQLRRFCVRTPHRGFRDRVGEHRLEAITRHIAQQVLERWVDEVVEEVTEFHDVAIGVEDAPSSHIGRRLHRATNLSFVVTKCH
jgi:hypothetical protein